ncbi:MAG: pyocin R, lytic enzyme, partial [Gammaproteobacteria bacterium]|nr:pyocin R, lytic enzyme [Gammaproteobacteria bacterium]
MLTATDLQYILPSATRQNIDLFIEPLRQAMDEFGVDTPARQAAFLAQIGHESGSLRYVRELASGDAYEGCAD